ncbi:MAG TPA: hypothetical protein VM182_11820 [Terriglobia bacterium]|nr:hypothetical protein [Terriglobia bacterium]
MIHLIAGLVVLVVGAWGIIAWWDDFGAVLRGFLPAWLVLVGLAAIATGLQKTMHKAEHEQGNWEEPGADALARPSEE